MTCPDLDADVFKYSASLGPCTNKNGFTWRDFRAEIHDEIWVLPKAGPFQHKHVIVGSAIYVCQLSTFNFCLGKIQS